MVIGKIRTRLATLVLPSQMPHAVISGFNTDIEFGGTVYHVQTEDKGLYKRVIMSLVYDKGTILANKRVSYDDLSTIDFDEKELSERLGQQRLKEEIAAP